MAVRLLRLDRVPIPIALALTSFDPGGTERQVTELISRFDPATFTVHAVCLRREGLWLPRAEASAASVVEFRLNGFASASAARRVWQFAAWCRRHQIALVHACDFYANVFTLPAAALAGVPVRIGSRRDLRLPQRSASQHRLQRHAYRFAHRVVANSEAAARQVASEGVPESRVSVVRNGIDASSYTPGGARRRGPVITTVANLRPEKGHDTLIDAARLVCARIPEVTFRVVGDGKMRPALEQRAREQGVASHVEFCGHREDIAAVLSESDLFVLPSRTEAFPNSLLEAMAAALPSIASDVGGIPEVVEHDVNGLLVPVANSQVLAEAIVALLLDAPRAAALGKAARQTIVSRYSFERMAGEMEALYLQELAGRGQLRDSAAALGVDKALTGHAAE
jgi:glycosyltransferase involved in cell wall biosynthesis